MLLNTLGVNHGSKITCEDLSSFMNIAPEEIQEGIEIDQVYAVLKRYGLCYRHWDFIKRPQENFADFIHSAIESGGAAMVSFYCRNRAGQLSAHIVPVFGHTLNSDAWYSQARKAYGQRLPSYEWYNTTDWVPHFIVHDDNFGMYYCMEVSRMQPQIGPQEKLGKTDLQKIPEMVAGICIGVYPKSSWTDRQVYEVQGLAIAAIRYLFESARQAEILEDLRAVQPPWFDRLYKSFDPIEPVNFPVLRSFLISRAKYEEHLAKDDWERNPLDPQQKSDILASLPDQFWMVELSLPDLFTANKRKLGEVLLRTSGAYKRLSPDSGVIGVRLPSVYFRLGGARPKFFLLRTRSHLPMLKLDEQVEEL
jgi:hypothetical protein